jgi:hypothetical protein
MRRQKRDHVSAQQIRCFVAALAVAYGAVSLHVVDVYPATAFSTDGEATVYRDGDFRGPFALEYEAVLRARPRNRAWSTLSLLLLGGAPPADAISIGLVSERGDAHVFTSTVHDGANRFHDTGIVCSGECAIGLRGDRGSIVAVVMGKTVRSWPRFDVSLPHPAVQLNAEVSGPGDRIDAEFAPLDERAADTRLERPVCGFTTQGVVPMWNAGTIRFSGSFVRGDPAQYIDLRSGKRIARCPAA